MCCYIVHYVILIFFVYIILRDLKCHLVVFKHNPMGDISNVDWQALFLHGMQARATSPEQISARG